MRVQLNNIEDCHSQNYSTLKFVVISDTHNCHDQIMDSLTSGDVLIHTGDFTNYGTIQEISKFNEFLGNIREKYGYKYVVVISGNHEVCLDPYYYSQENRHILLSNVTHFLHNSFVIIDGVKIYGSPYNDKTGAFGMSNLEPVWSIIPDDTDILLTHIPPFNILDLAWDTKSDTSGFCSECRRVHKQFSHWGCKKLTSHVINRVKPKVHIFGHVHDCYGVQTTSDTIFINAATKWSPMRDPIVFDYPVSQQYYDQRKQSGVAFDKVISVNNGNIDSDNHGIGYKLIGFASNMLGYFSDGYLTADQSKPLRIFSYYDPNLIVTALPTNEVVCTNLQEADNSQQIWCFTKDQEIVLHGSDLVLTVSSTDERYFDEVMVSKRSGDTSQQWELDSSHRLISKKTGQALDLDIKNRPIGNLILYKKLSNKNQKWRLVNTF